MVDHLHPFYRMQYLFAYQRDTFLARYHKRATSRQRSA